MYCKAWLENRATSGNPNKSALADRHVRDRPCAHQDLLPQHDQRTATKAAQGEIGLLPSSSPLLSISHGALSRLARCHCRLLLSEASQARAGKRRLD